MNEKPGHCLKIGLSIQIRLVALSVAGTQPECNLVHSASKVSVDRCSNASVLGLEPKIFVDYQSNPCLFTQFGHHKVFDR